MWARRGLSTLFTVKRETYGSDDNSGGVNETKSNVLTNVRGIMQAFAPNMKMVSQGIETEILYKVLVDGSNDIRENDTITPNSGVEANNEFIVKSVAHDVLDPTFFDYTHLEIIVSKYKSARTEP